MAPVVGDFDGQGKGEIAIAWSNKVAVYDHQGKVMAGWPQTVPGGAGEIRSLASADIDRDGKMEIMVVKAGAGPSTMAYTAGGTPVPGWPQAKDCDKCFDKGGLTQTLGVADLDGDGNPEVVVPYDTSHVGILHADGKPFAADTSFAAAGPWVSDVPFYHDEEFARQGTGTDNSLRDVFTHSPPAFADIDGDGKLDLILYSTHKRVGDTAILGNCLWVLRHDMRRAKGFEKPLCSDAPIFTRNWNDILETSPSPAIADLDADGKPEIIVPSNDGHIRAYASDGSLLWKYKYDSPGEPWIMATEVVIGDLSKDGKPEVVLNTYSVDHFVSTLTILDSRGRLQRKALLDKRGSMAAPTLADVDGDGKIDIVVTLKDVIGGGKGGVQVWTMESAGNAKPLWPTGRGGYLRAGWTEGVESPVSLVKPFTRPGRDKAWRYRTNNMGPWFDLLGNRTEKHPRNSRLLIPPLR